MKTLALALALMLVHVSIAQAQQTAVDAPATKEDIERYMDVMHSRDMMTQMVAAMSKPLHQVIHEQYLKDKDRLPADFETRMNNLMDETMASIPWNDMLDAMIPVYQKHLTKGDVDAMVAFYQTPTGQKLIKEMPTITAEAMQTMMPLMQKQIATMTERMQGQVAAMLKDSEKSGKAKPSSTN
jgi:uncharacterized protein